MGYINQQKSRGTYNAWYEIVGVVPDMGFSPGGADPKVAGFYHPVAPGSVVPAQIAIHVMGNPEALTPKLRAIATEVDPTIRLYDIVPLDEVNLSELEFIAFDTSYEAINAMGTVKFEFPNAQGIYLHDTPDKHLLREDARQLSSGCVRLEDAARMHRWLMGTALPTRADGRSLRSMTMKSEPSPRRADIHWAGPVIVSPGAALLESRHVPA